LGRRWGQEEDEGPGIQPSLSTVLPVLLGGLELLRRELSWWEGVADVRREAW